VDGFILLALPVHIFDPLLCFQIWNYRSTAPVVAIDGLTFIHLRELSLLSTLKDKNRSVSFSTQRFLKLPII